MGRPIVYCDGCGKLLREEDFARGRARELDHRNFCSECRPPAVESPPAPPLPKKHVSSRSIPVAPRPSSKSQPAVPPAPSAAPSKKGLWIGLGAGGLLVLAIVGAVASSGGKARSGGEEEIRLRGGPPRTSSSPAPAPANEVSREPLLRALAFKRAHPNDVGGQIRELEAALRELAGTSHEADAKRELALARRRVEKELEELDGLTAPLSGREEFGPALSLLDAARRRYDFPDWVRAVDAKTGRLREALERAKAEIRAQAEEAKKRRSSDDLSRLAGRVERWGLNAEGQALAAHLTLEVPKPPPPPTAPAPAPAPAAPASRLPAALPHVAARDFDAALAALGPDAKEEAELLRGAKAAYVEGLAALLRAPRGKPLALEYRDAWGVWTKVDDVLLRGDAARLEFKLGQDSLVVPVGEVSLRALADAYLARPNAKPEDAKAADALRGLDADGEADPEARRLFYDAEHDIYDPERAAEARDAYRKLLEEHASTSFVRRNRVAIQARVEPLKERVFLAEDMKAAGTFKLVPHRKVERGWTSEKDSTSWKENYVEVDVDLAPGKAPKLFALLGGCCAETFAAHVSFGGDVELPLKHTLTGLKRRHEDHLGPKEPDRWEWVSIPLPKGTEAVRKLRILTDQKGFSVATIVATSERASPSKDWDAKEVERRRAEIPGYLSKGGARMGRLTLEIYNGGGGGVEDLKRIAGYPDKPAARRALKDFESARNAGDDFGSRARGFLHPPLTGDYEFWVTSDDQSELWLSADDDPKNMTRIANMPEWASWTEWEKHGSQRSKPVRLEAGRRYYVELLHKEGTGEDHFRVRWKLPDGRMEEPIPSARLSAWTKR